MTDDAGSLLGLIRSGRSGVPRPVDAPASVGDYVAGPNHVLPTNRDRPASPAPCGSTTSASTSTSSSVDDDGRRRARPPRGDAWPRPRACRPTPSRFASDGRAGERLVPAACPARPADDLGLRDGLPLAPGRRRRSDSTPTSRRCRRRPAGSRPWRPSVAEDRSSTGTRTARPPRSAPRLAELPRGRPRRRSSAPTAPTRCCSACCLAYGGPGRAAAVFEPTYALHRTSPASPAPRWPRASAGRRLRPRPRRGRPRARRGRRRRSPSSARPTTRPGGPRPARAVARGGLGLAPGLVVVDEAYGQFAPASALDLLRDGGPGADRSWSSGPSPRRGRWPAARLGYLVADPEVVAGL